MKIHEYQARELMGKAGIPVPPAVVVDNPEAAGQAFKQNGAASQVVKAQVFAGGRGKADGLSADGKRIPGPWLFVKVDVKTPDDAVAAAKFMLNHRMVSKQTGPDGIEVDKILVAASVDIDKEYYLSIT